MLRLRALGWMVVPALGVVLLTACGEDDEKKECEKGLCVASADRALATSFNATFDWTTDKVAVELIAKPTRAQLERGIYVNNPALFDDPGGEPTVTPATLPTMSNTATFDFPVSQGDNTGQQALDTTMVFDSAAASPLTAAELADAFAWGPALDFLLDWDFSGTLPLTYAASGISGQDWGGSSTLPPQAIEIGYLHGTEMWVKIVFQPFTVVDGSVTDTDGDGWPEVWAKLADVHVPGAGVTELRDGYITPRHDATALRTVLADVIEELYSETNPSVISDLGEPYTLEGVGKFEYPFAVIGHGVKGTGSYVEQLLLVEP